jgi:UDP-N-acetylmuramoyl-tripeptide--D-alanyl-D-alanine ligase
MFERPVKNMLKVHEIIKATAGRLVCGAGDSVLKDVSIDTRTITRGDAFIAIKGNNFDGHEFLGQALQKGARCLVVKRGGYAAAQKARAEGISLVEVEDTLKALGDIALFLRRRYGFPVIAVTGSAGKTTVKEMVAWVLSKKFNVLKTEGTKNNQIGLPLTLLRANKDHDMAILELGTNHPGEIGYLTGICEPTIGIITNIGPAHLEYFNTLDGVFDEKYALIRNLKKPHIAVLNADDSALRKRLGRTCKEPAIFSFGITHDSDFRASDIKYGIGTLEFYLNSVPAGNIKKRAENKKYKYKFKLNTLGYNNIYNAQAAIAVARIFGMEYRDISLRLATFTFPKSRLNLLRVNNVTFIDDTYNSNPLSLTQALGALDSVRTAGRKIFVMGDMLELGERKESFHSQIGRQVVKICDAFVAVGNLSKLAADTARSCGLGAENIFTCGSCLEARDILFNIIAPQEEDVVLIKGSRGMKMEEIFRKE